MTEYESGAIAEVTYKGKRVRAARVGSGWQTLEPVDGYTSWTMGDRVTDIRPLVVLDPEDREQVNGLVQMSHYLQPGAITGQLTECIQNGLRSLVKPARIPEPGWGQKVVASTAGYRSRRSFLNTGRGWIERDHDERASLWRWDDLVDPERI